MQNAQNIGPAVYGYLYSHTVAALPSYACLTLHWRLYYSHWERDLCHVGSRSHGRDDGGNEVREEIFVAIAGSVVP